MVVSVLFSAVTDSQRIPTAFLIEATSNKFPWDYYSNSKPELIQTQMAQKPMLRAEVGMRVRCANKASAE